MAAIREIQMCPIRNRAVAVLVAAWLLGCSTPQTTVGTGAREVGQSFFEALVKKDWRVAYAALHPNSQAACNVEEFGRRAERYRRSLDFEPEAVHVRSCEEHGAEAVMHVVFLSEKHAGGRLFRDAVTLRTTPTGWAVILPDNFGKQR
jgi:hypothetical protein